MNQPREKFQVRTRTKVLFGLMSLLLLAAFAALLFQRLGVGELEFLDALAFDLAGIDVA